MKNTYQHTIQMGIEHGIHKAAMSAPAKIWPAEADLIQMAWAKISASFDSKRCGKFVASAGNFAELVAYRMCLTFIESSRSLTRKVRKVAPLLAGTTDDRAVLEASEHSRLVAATLATMTPAVRSALRASAMGENLNGAQRVAKHRGMAQMKKALRAARV